MNSMNILEDTDEIMKRPTMVQHSVNRGLILDRQADTKDFTSSSKFSGSCVLTLQTISSTAFLFLISSSKDYILHIIFYL